MVKGVSNSREILNIIVGTRGIGILFVSKNLVGTLLIGYFIRHCGALFFSVTL